MPPPDPAPDPATPAIVARTIRRPLVLLIIGAAMVIGATVLAGRATHRLLPAGETPLATLAALIVGTFAVLAYKLFKRFVEREPDRELARRGAVRHLGAGLLFGAALFTLAAGIVALLGGLEVLGVRGWGHIWSLLAMAIVSGTVEEIVFRALALRLLERLVGSWLALALTAAFFGLAHLGNPGATAFSALAIAFEAGIMLGAAYLVTRTLWFAIGIHAAWNFTQGWVFSIPVSGGGVPIGLLVTRRLGSEWLTGGAFGLEASVVAMVVATAAGVGLLWRAARLGAIIAPPWRRSRARRV